MTAFLDARNLIVESIILVGVFLLPTGTLFGSWRGQERAAGELFILYENW